MWKKLCGWILLAAIAFSFSAQFLQLSFGGGGESVSPIGMQPELAGNVSAVLSIQQKMVNGVSADVCLLDSESMWGTGLHTTASLGEVKRAFEQLTSDVFMAIKKNSVPCESVTILVNLFPSTSIQGRERRPSEHWINFKYTGQPGCGILVLSDWYAKVTAENSTENKTWWEDWLYSYQRLYAWHVIPFATDDLLKNIANESKSNEIQRLSKLLKSAVALYVPAEVQRVTYADAKCKLNMFFNMSAKTDTMAQWPPSDIVTLAHPDRFGKPLKDEFFEVRRFMGERTELPPVYADIDRLEKFLGEEILNRSVDLGDIQCMTFQKSKAVETFARRWFWYIATFSMRGQLSWNPALFDCGEGLKIKYLVGGGYFPGSHPNNPVKSRPSPKKRFKKRLQNAINDKMRASLAA